MVKPSVAVLLAAYNGMRWIEEQLASICAQRQVAVTVFISVDVSTDSTRAWCEQYAQANPNIVVLPQVERLGGAGRNFFRLLSEVDFQSFDYVALADQDDLWYPDKLQRAVFHLQSSSSAAYSSNVNAFWPDGRQQLIDKAQPQVTRDYLFEAAGPGCTYVLEAALAAALKAHIQANWADVQKVTLHDWFIYAFARSYGFNWFIDTVPGLDYRQHAFNQVGANIGVKSLLRRFASIRGGWWFDQVFRISRLMGDPWPLLAVTAPTRLTFFKLACSAGQCRRRQRDKHMFRLVCLAACVFGAPGA